MQFYHALLTLTAIPTTVWDAYDLVDYNDAKITADDAVVKGFSLHPCTVVGDPTAVGVIGFCRVKARGAITKGDKLISAAAGGVKTAPGNAVNPFARALNSAADGEFVTFLMH